MASDSVNGPLIGVIDTSGEALAKEGGLTAGTMSTATCPIWPWAATR